MSDDRNDLLDAVDGLTKPIRNKIIQDHGTVTVVLPALLEQLDAAIRQTVGDRGGGALANERSPLNNEALYKATIITSQIRDWARMVGLTPKPADKPWGTLRQWYIAYCNTHRQTDDTYVNQLNNWHNQIVNMFDPPRIHDFPNPCPTCGATSWVNETDGLTYNRPLVITYKPDSTDLIQQAKGMCRACNKVWTARELAYTLEEIGDIA